jgi:ABC-type Zn uptake system ZnuABC Zn-binding protein ZnuA
MNRIILSILILSFLGSELAAQKKWKVVSSTSIFQDMAKTIGQDKIESYSIVPIGGDPHIYEPRPSDASLVESADLILVNGFNFEGWITELIENSGTKAKVVTITKGVKPIASLTYKNAYDPHAWMDAIYGQSYIKNISESLQDMDPDNKETYAKNTEAYLKELKDLHQYIEKAIEKIPEKTRVLITSHDAFSYYGDRYGIEVSPIMGISTDAEAQTSDISRVTKIIKDSGVPAVFIESTINPKLLKQIAEDNGVGIGGELFSDSIGEEDSEADTYLNMLKHNTDVIVGALSEGRLTKTKIDEDDTSFNLYLYLGLGILMLGSIILLLIKAQK